MSSGFLPSVEHRYLCKDYCGALIKTDFPTPSRQEEKKKKVLVCFLYNTKLI